LLINQEPKNMSHQSLVLTQKSGKDLSKLQKQFNSNVKKINELKQKLEDDTAGLRQIITRIKAEIFPLEEKHNNTLVEMVYVFDKHYDDPYFKKKEKEKIADFIMEKSTELIQSLGKDELKPIYDKYAEESYDEMNAEAEGEASDLMKNMMKSMFGIEVGDDEIDLTNPEKMQEYVAQKLEEKEEEAATKKANKKKSAKQIEKEEKDKEEAKNISKAARSIYADLVKAFHPDRELDEVERDRKTEIMKQVTEAYSNDDLFELLRLKIELQGSDIESLTMVDEQLKYYNKMLKEQINELENNLWQLRMQASGPMGGKDLFMQFGGDEKTMKSKFTREINRLKKGTQELEKDIAQLKNKEAMRGFLKDYQIVNFDEDDFMNFLPPNFFR
jgi:hypothetical protein